MLAEWSFKIRRNRFEVKDKGKEDHSHSQQIKLNNFTVSLWDIRKEVLYPISIAFEAEHLRHHYLVVEHHTMTTIGLINTLFYS